jgi:hypothetical protein
MNIVGYALTILLMAGLGFLTWRIMHLRRLVVTLEHDLRELGLAWKTLPPDAPALLPEKAAFISIEILNPIELAAKESRMAGTMGGLAPGLIRGIVYRRTTSMLRDQLAENGVQAEVQLHGID